MEKVQKINIAALIISGSAALYYFGLIIITFPVVFIMGFDSPQSHFFSLNTIYGIFSILFYQYRVVAFIFFAIALFSYLYKKFSLSIVLCIITIFAAIGIGYHLDYQQKIDTIKQKAYTIDSEKANGTFPQNDPPQGFLVPTPAFIPSGYKETSHKYGNASVAITYMATDATGAKSYIDYFENNSKYGQIKSFHPIYQFNHNGYPGDVMPLTKSSYGKDLSPGHVGYELQWDDNGKLVRIDETNVLEENVDPQKIEKKLDALQRVP